MKHCKDCFLFSNGFCRLQYEDPIHGGKLNIPLTAIEARSYTWACPKSKYFSRTYPEIYAKTFGLFSEAEINHTES